MFVAIRRIINEINIIFWKQLHKMYADNVSICQEIVLGVCFSVSIVTYFPNK